MHCDLTDDESGSQLRAWSDLLPSERLYAFIGADKGADLGEATDTGAEMTEEEWNLRVAELNKHQVSSAEDNACAAVRRVG